MKISRVAGTTSEILSLFIRDSSSTTGAGLTGLVFNSASLTAYYARNNQSSATAISLVTMTLGTYTSGGFKEIDATNMPGWYQFCPPAGVFTSGGSAAIHLKGATNMAPLPIEVQITAWNNQDAVRGGLTALPNAAAEAAGGLYTRGTGAGQINQAANGQVDANLARILNTAVSSPATAGILDVNVKNMNNVAATSITTIAANQGTTQPLNFTGTAASALVKTDMVDIAGAAVNTASAQIGANVVTQANIDFGALQKASLNAATPASVTGAVGSVTGNVGGNVVGNVNGTVATVTNLTNAPTSGDFTATMKTSLNASTPASVTGAVGSVTGNVGGNVNGSVASVTGLVPARLDVAVSTRGTGDASAANQTTINNNVLSVAAAVSTVDTVVDAIKLKTDNIPAAPATEATAQLAVDKAAMAATLAAANA